MVVIENRYYFRVQTSPKVAFRRMYLGHDGLPKWHKKDAERATFSKDELERAIKWADSKKYRHDHPKVDRWPSLTGDFKNLHPDLLDALQACADERGDNIFIRDGFRSRAEQQAMWDRAQRDPSAPRANRPGTSSHEAIHGDPYGHAADCAWGNNRNGRDIARFSADRVLVQRHGLKVPYSVEPWHVELA